LEWQFAILIVVGGSLFLMMLGLPVAFCLLAVDIIGVYLWWGGVAGLEQLTASIRDGVGSFILLPIPLFILMGEIMYHANIVPNLLNSLDKWIGRLPGRLSLLAVGGGTLLGTLTGVTMGSVALMGSTMVPEMEKRGYQKSMVLGPVGSIGVLAAMIPPSILGVLIAGLAQISIGRVLIGIIIPGLLISALFSAYIILRCTFQPSIAPPYDVPHSTVAEKVISFIHYVLPIGFIIFLVIGLIFLGVATPSEAAATGVIGCIIIALIYGHLNWKVVKKSCWGCLQISIMVLMVIAAARAFGQVLAFSGANAGLVKFATDLNLSPMSMLIMMQAVVLVGGCIMDIVALIMLLIPMYMPIVKAFGFNEVWFAVVLLLSTTIGAVSPPFGLDLFALKGTVGPHNKLGDIYKAVLPFIVLDLVVVMLMIAFPQLVLWLPDLMR